MTARQLRARINYIGPTHEGRFLVQILYRGNYYKCYSANTAARLAVFCYDFHNIPNRQALQALYDECKQENNLR